MQANMVRTRECDKQTQVNITSTSLIILILAIVNDGKRLEPKRRNLLPPLLFSHRIVHDGKFVLALCRNFLGGEQVRILSLLGLDDVQLSSLDLISVGKFVLCNGVVILLLSSHPRFSVDRILPRYFYSSGMADVIRTFELTMRFLILLGQRRFSAQLPPLKNRFRQPLTFHPTLFGGSKVNPFDPLFFSNPEK